MNIIIYIIVIAIAIIRMVLKAKETRTKRSPGGATSAFPTTVDPMMPEDSEWMRKLQEEMTEESQIFQENETIEEPTSFETQLSTQMTSPMKAITLKRSDNATKRYSLAEQVRRLEVVSLAKEHEKVAINHDQNAISHFHRHFNNEKSSENTGIKLELNSKENLKKAILYAEILKPRFETNY